MRVVYIFNNNKSEVYGFLIASLCLIEIIKKKNNIHSMRFLTLLNNKITFSDLLLFFQCLFLRYHSRTLDYQIIFNLVEMAFELNMQEKIRVRY